MFKKTATKLLEQNADKVTQWLDTFDAVITDCDGVLWVYGDVLPGAAEVMNRFKEMGKKIFFCTNNSTKTRKELLVKSHNMGFNITEEEVISTAHSLAAYLKNRNFNKKVFVIGSEGITKELDAVGIDHTKVGPEHMPGSLQQYLSNHFKLDDNIGAVVVGFDEYFSFPKMTKAASYLNNPECLFIATNTDERFPMPNMVVPGTGSFVRAIETCAERKATVIGKPNVAICEHLIKDGTIVPERTLMIGDRCNTDILLGYNCGFQTMLVGTGIHQLNDVDSWKASDDPELHKLLPDVYLPKLGDLLPYM
ncbi:glycerol-3-phosphate phosphatase isoform X1 [Stomoxys calcitrans]|uniref:glycerol-3-phosphate phosphatase isoform X1 n=1 Tax=Stomoxys calcitrans TaxID=35570 RepID=UPI0027E29A64|nr:glycerol-3-phosphate phosphatase isoform X1 [Stomoxys calcitrans]